MSKYIEKVIMLFFNKYNLLADNKINRTACVYHLDPPHKGTY